jgi:hypothetical protein
MGGRRTLPSMMEKRDISCYYEHNFLSVRQGELLNLKEEYRESRALGFSLTDSWSG